MLFFKLLDQLTSFGRVIWKLSSLFVPVKRYSIKSWPRMKLVYLLKKAAAARFARFDITLYYNSSMEYWVSILILFSHVFVSLESIKARRIFDETFFSPCPIIDIYFTFRTCSKRLYYYYYYYCNSKIHHTSSSSRSLSLCLSPAAKLRLAFVRLGWIHPNRFHQNKH